MLAWCLGRGRESVVRAAAAVLSPGHGRKVKLIHTTMSQAGKHGQVVEPGAQHSCGCYHEQYYLECNNEGENN